MTTAKIDPISRKVLAMSTTEIPIGTRVHVKLGRSEYTGAVLDTWQPNGAVSTYYDVRNDADGLIIFGVADHQIRRDNS